MNTSAAMTLWKRRIDDCKNSGVKVTEWCSENDVSRHAYYYWHRKIKEYEAELVNKGNDPLFAEIVTEDILNVYTNVPVTKELTVTWKECSITVPDMKSVVMAAELMNRLDRLC